MKVASQLLTRAEGLSLCAKRGFSLALIGGEGTSNATAATTTVYLRPSVNSVRWNPDTVVGTTARDNGANRKQQGLDLRLEPSVWVGREQDARGQDLTYPSVTASVPSLQSAVKKIQLLSAFIQDV